MRRFKFWRSYFAEQRGAWDCPAYVAWSWSMLSPMNIWFVPGTADPDRD